MAALTYISLLLMAATVYCYEFQPLVFTQQGLVRGETRRSGLGGVFYAFKGIPYARAPVGQLRFKPPQRHPAWHGISDATKFGSRCLQYNLYNNNTKEGSEDCLFVNVYTPSLPGLSPLIGGLPVMVWIHGGSYTMGSGEDRTYGPEYLVDGNVVLVTLNYRLGPFGFFSTFDRAASGNYAFLDQIMALRWVQDNIASFGGNPNSVTIFGESAGGACVSMLVLSPLSKGLFHRAISQSGSLIAEWGASGQRTGAEEKFAKLLNCSHPDSVATVDCMRNVSADAIIDTFKALGQRGIHFLPRVDTEAEYPVLPEDPRSILEEGTFNRVPWMNGVTEEEGEHFLNIFLKDPKFVAGAKASTPEAMGKLAGITKPTLINILDCGANVTAVSTAVLRFYAGNGSLSDDKYRPIVQIMGDRSFNVPMSEEVRLASKHTLVYKYVLDHKGPGRLSTLNPPFGEGPVFGPTHTDDLFYLFKFKDVSIPPRNSPAHKMIYFMVEMWTNFARVGHAYSYVFPTPDWPSFTEENPIHMRLNSKPSIGRGLFQERVNFWLTLPFNEPWKHVVQTDECP